jgi:hypothetical protein
LYSRVETTGKSQEGGKRGGVRVFVFEAGLRGGIELGGKTFEAIEKFRN